MMPRRSRMAVFSKNFGCYSGSHRMTLRRSLAFFKEHLVDHPPVRLDVKMKSGSGSLSNQGMRNRFPLFTFFAQDPALQEFLFRRSLVFCYDVPVYNYLAPAFFVGVLLAAAVRYTLFQPEMYLKRQELKKPFPDRHRQYSFAHPYYNSRGRNFASKFRRCFIDNEPDLMDAASPLGLRPARKQTSRKLPLGIFGIPRYAEQDPLYTSTTHANMSAIYRQIGYSQI